VQLIFTREEQQSLAEVLEELSLRGEGPVKIKSYALLDRVIAHNFGMAADELEDLHDILAAYKKMMRQQLTTAPAGDAALRQKQQILDKIMDKVTEACMMV